MKTISAKRALELLKQNKQITITGKSLKPLVKYIKSKKQ
jgi:hypothetical protein